MAVTSILTAKPLFLSWSKRGQNFHGNRCSVEFAKPTTTSKFGSFKAKSFLKSSSSSGKNAAQFTVSSSSKENPFKNFVSKTFHWLKIPTTVMMLSLFFMMMMMMMSGGHWALARSGGKMGGRSFSRRSSSTWKSRRWGRLSKSSTDEEEGDYEPTFQETVIFLFLSVIVVNVVLANQGTSVIKLQVGLLVTEPSLQRDLNWIAKTTDSSNSKDWSLILKKTRKTLLQHSKFWVSCYSSVKVKKSLSKAEECFMQDSIKERKKFDEDEKNVASPDQTNQFRSTYIVVTILVAAEGVIRLPIIRDSNDLKTVLEKFYYDDLQAVHVLWTPREENDVMSLEEVSKDYPLLKPLVMPNITPK